MRRPAATLPDRLTPLKRGSHPKLAQIESGRFRTRLYAGRVRRGLILTAALVALLPGCGGGDGGGAKSAQRARGPVLHVASATEYTRAVGRIGRRIQAADRRLRARARGPGRRAAFLSAASTASRQSELLTGLNPPEKQLSNHQLLIDAVANLELDIHDAVETSPGPPPLGDIERDFQQVHKVTRQTVKQSL